MGLEEEHTCRQSRSVFDLGRVKSLVESDVRFVHRRAIGTQRQARHLIVLSPSCLTPTPSPNTRQFTTHLSSAEYKTDPIHRQGPKAKQKEEREERMEKKGKGRKKRMYETFNGSSPTEA